MLERDVGIGFTTCFAKNVGREHLGRVDDALFGLRPRTGTRNQTGRHRGRTERRGITLEHQHFRTALVSRKRCGETATAGTDDQNRDVR